MLRGVTEWMAGEMKSSGVTALIRWSLCVSKYREECEVFAGVVETVGGVE